MTYRLVTNFRHFWMSVPATLRRNFRLDFTASICVGVFMAGVTSFVSVVARRLGASPFLLSLIVAAPFAGNIAALLAAHFLQGRRKLPYMVAAWCAGRGLFLLMPFVIAPLPFVLIIVLYWLIVSAPMPGYVEVVQQLYPDAVRGRVMSYVRVGFTACMTLLTPLAGRLLDAWGYRVLFPIAACFGILGPLTFRRVQYEEVVSEKRHDLLEPWRILARDAVFRRYSVAITCWGVGNLIMAPLVPLLLVDELRLSYSQVGLLGLVNSAFWMVFYVIWGRAVDRRGGLWTMKANVFLTAFVPLALFLAGDLWLVAVAYIVMGITNAGGDLGWINTIMQFGRRGQVADYTALYAGLAGIRGLIMPLLGTALLAVPWIGLRGVFLLSTLLILGSALLVYRVRIPVGGVAELPDLRLSG